MKIALPCYLLGLAVVWCSASWGENPAPTGMYQATIANDGVQHVTMDSGRYCFKPNHVMVKVPVELSVKAESGLAPITW